VQDLLRHSVPTGDPAEIFDRALTKLLEHLQRTKMATTDRPRARETSPFKSRHIPAAVKREVWTRDGGRCAFVGTHGRCTETGFLEFHHLEPFASGGAATSRNVQLRCRPHNLYEAELFFGPAEPPMARETRVVFWTGSDSVQTESTSMEPKVRQRRLHWCRRRFDSAWPPEIEIATNGNHRIGLGVLARA
jgi:hypothetical protein